MDNVQLLLACYHRIGLYQGYLTREFELLTVTSSFRFRARRAWAEGLVQLADLQCKLATTIFTTEVAEQAVSKITQLTELVTELKRLANTISEDLSIELFAYFVSDSYTTNTF